MCAMLVLSVRRIVVEVHVDAVVKMAMTQLPFSRLQGIECQRKSCGVCSSACKRAECSRNYTNAGNVCRARDCDVSLPCKSLLRQARSRLSVCSVLKMCTRPNTDLPRSCKSSNTRSPSEPSVQTCPTVNFVASSTHIQRCVFWLF